MRKKIGVDYKNDPLYQKELSDFRYLNGIYDDVFAHYIDDAAARDVIYTDPIESQENGWLNRILIHFGLVYSGEYDIMAERLIDRFGRPWVTQLEVVVSTDASRTSFLWRRTLFQRYPNLRALFGKVEAWIRDGGHPEIKILLKTTEADRRVWTVEKITRTSEDIRSLLMELYAASFADDATLGGSHPEIWEMRFRAIMRLSGSGSESS